MPNIQRSWRKRPALTFALAAVIAFSPQVGSAKAQDYRPDAEGYPCAGKAKLEVVNDSQGFSIRQRKVDAPARPLPAPVLIPVGATFKFDPKIFEPGAARREEAADASRR